MLFILELYCIVGYQKGEKVRKNSVRKYGDERKEGEVEK
jgi:hypothetical protein